MRENDFQCPTVNSDKKKSTKKQSTITKYNVQSAKRKDNTTKTWKPET